jgi:hypothetical protein
MNKRDTIIEHQVRWLCRRLGVTPERARSLVGLIFEHGERA